MRNNSSIEKLYLKTFGNEKWLYESGLKDYFETYDAIESRFNLARYEYSFFKNVRSEDENLESFINLLSTITKFLTLTSNN